MAGKDIIVMRVTELRRLKVIQEAISKKITQTTAAAILWLSERQVGRLVKAVRKEGERGIVHKSRGKPSNCKISADVRGKTIGLYKGKYHDFGPTLAAEKLKEIDEISISEETLRKWLIEEGLWKKKRKRKEHRQWRERKECFGEMVQMDGSHHDWLEGRSHRLALMGYIDYATSKVFARFYDYEGTMPAMDSFKQYIEVTGLPQSIYVDKHSTYKSQGKLTIEEELEGLEEPMSQFERALEELGVEVIHAHSPQAKGRIERLFGTFQDRVIKEMRLKGIKTKEEANDFIEGYLPDYNKRFSRPPANETDVHVRLPKNFDIDNFLCIKMERTVRKDNTISHESKLYQIEEVVRTKKVTVEERVDGSLHITSNGGQLRYRQIEERPKNEKTEKTLKPRKRYIPPKDHPWRKGQNRGSNQKRVNY